MRLATYNPDQGRRELGLGLGMIAPAWQRGGTDEAVIKNWLDRSWVMGRDGVLTPTGGTGGAILSPRRGVSVTGPDSFDLPVPGYGSLKMAMAWDAITNLCADTNSSLRLAANSYSAPARVITEDNTTNTHYARQAAGVTLTDAATYRVGALIERVTGSRHAVLEVLGDSTTGVVVNLDTLAATNLAASGGTVSDVVVTRYGTTGAVVWFRATSTGWGAAPKVIAGFSSNGTSLNSYAGDNTSSLRFSNITLTPLTDYSPLMAENIVRAADSWVWTLPAVLPQDCEFTSPLWQPHADGGMGIATQIWFEGVTTSTFPRIYRGAADTTMVAADYDTGSKTKNVTRTLPSRGIIAVQRLRRYTDSVDGGYGAALAGTPTAGGAWLAQDKFKIGFGATAGRASRAGTALIITPGGCTQSERDAAARTFHLVPLAAAA
jgi:hypothetical protein